jgi:DnaK suppressor protein
MTKIEMIGFHDALMSRQDELGNRNRGRELLAVETSSDDLDRIQNVQERDLAIGTFDRNAKLLREVRSALDRIAGGTFGLCLDCEENISTKRLAAVPWTPFCIVCQEAADSADAAPWGGATQPLFHAA